MITRRRPLLFFLMFFVGLTLIFVFPYRQLIQDALADPIAYYLWYIQKIWRSLDSDFIWGSFILMLYALILMIFPTFRILPQLTNQDELITQGGRLTFWLYEVRRLTGQQGFSRFSVVELKKLVLEVIAFREQLETRQDAEQWLVAHEQDVPPAVVALFDRRISSKVDHTGGDILEWWRNLWQPRKPYPTPQQQNEENIKAIIQFLENQLEMHHDYEYR